MASTKLYLDARNVPVGNVCPLKIAIYTAQSTSFINLGIKVLPKQWDKKGLRVVNHPQKDAINLLLTQRKQDVDMFIYEHTRAGMQELSAKELKEAIENGASSQGRKNQGSLFIPYFENFITRYKSRTHDIYLATLRKVQAYVGERGAKRLRFEDINKEWLVAFDSFLSGTSPSQNARNIHFRNIRAVFNDAIDEEVTQAYPFRRFKIKQQQTRKRSFKIDALRKIFNAKLTGHEAKYRDLFKLIFCLCGINFVDLCNLKEIVDGRIEYNRAKTHRHYSIKVEPEAMEIIDRFRGKDYLLSFLDTNKRYRCFYMNFCRGLKAVKDRLNAIDDGIVIDELTSYWSRHSWATIAASLDIPKDTIAAALGHGGYTVTDIYIDFEQRKVDEANRRVLDYVFDTKPEPPASPSGAKPKRGRPRKNSVG